MSADEDSRTPWRESLGFILLVWFLIISIVPLSFYGFFNYKDRIEQLENKYKTELETAILSHEIFINNWFKYRKSDIVIWSQAQNSINLFSSLNKIYRQAKDINQFLESYDYALIVDKYEGDLVRLKKEYDYIYDFLFIDLDGNIFYSLKKESDLGSNLLQGSLASSKLASSFAKSVETGGIYFSDLEHYSPSDNIATGFITAPIIDNNGDLKGVMAVQIEPKHLNDTFDANIQGRYHYLVGEDGLLRSNISSNKKILDVKVDTQQVRLWKEKHINHEDKGHVEYFFDYKNPDNKMVMGTHRSLDIMGVKWVIISEVEHALIFADKGKLFRDLILFLLVMIGIIVLVAAYLSKVITKPIRDLTEASILFTRGNRDTTIINSFKGEVGELAKAFKAMLISLGAKEAELKKLANGLEERVKQEVELNSIKDKQLLEQSKIAQEKLNKSIDQFSENVISSSSDVHGNITFVSKALCEISGYVEDELLGQPHSILRHPDMPSTVFEDLWKTIQSGRPWDGEIKNRKKDGGFYWVRSSVIPNFDDNHTIVGYTSIRHDITPQKAKEQFMANMSHELRTPLNAIIGFGSILGETLHDANNIKFIKLINASAQSLLSLVNDILDLSKIKNSKFSINPYVFNAYKEITEYAEQFKGLTNQKSLSLKSRVNENLKAEFYGDWIRISQILLNLVSNAIKFTPKGGEISYTISYIDDSLVFKISDNGIGMNKEVQDKIFKPFEQADGSTTREYGGTGLGLTIVQNLVDLMGGKIELHSEAGVGSTFTVTIPLKKVDDGLEMSNLFVPKEKVNATELSGLHVLVAEDDEVNQLLAEVLLAQLGMTCDIAYDGHEAVKMYDPSKHKLILMDENMPNMNGIEAMKAIKSKYKERCGPIIALTANAMEGDEKRFLDLGMDGYVPKPIDKHTLFQVLKAVLSA